MRGKILILSILIMSLYSCSSDDNNSEYYNIKVVFVSNNPDSNVYISGTGIVGGKYIKKEYIEVVTVPRYNEKRFYARCEDKETLLTIKIFNSKGKLIKEDSQNSAVAVILPYLLKM
ncbi:MULTISPECIES: hypothetical protein [unclassified Flavobacterium]|uniref:hypothetical protein n=1 Tax=unclassified Flavobacterium TaxID=196869 RepID=UPI00131C7A08|nr:MULTISPECIES: hypothetical protein [unclassified Flavobacterium]